MNEPLFVQVCFADPINIRDLHLGGDFAFSVTDPGGRGLGHRTVFQPDGYGAAIYPGPPREETTGEWTFGWYVTSPDGEQASEGEISYAVDPRWRRVSQGHAARLCWRAGNGDSAHRLDTNRRSHRSASRESSREG